MREEREKHVCAWLSRLIEPGVVWRGGAMGTSAQRAREVHQNPAQSLTGPRLPFVVYFATSSYLIRFDRDRSSRLRNVVTLGRSFL
jgi:hypothetical protein